MTTEQIIDVTRELGFPIAVALGLFVTFLSLLAGIGYAFWRLAEFAAPHASRVVDHHVKFLEKGTETMQVIQDKALGNDHKTHKALGHLGEAVLASTDEARKPHVQPHTKAVWNAVEDRE